jgi:hypothetical protein
MAEMRVLVEGGFNPATGTSSFPLPVTGTFTPSGTQTVTGTVTTIPNNGAAVISLSGASSVVQGAVYDLGYLSRDYTFVGNSSATLTAGIIRLFGSIDNVNFVQIGTDITAATDFPSATAKSYSGATDYRYFRADITTTITGGNVSFKILGA